MISGNRRIISKKEATLYSRSVRGCITGHFKLRRSKKQFTALSLFSGAGGFDCGFEYNGVDVQYFVEFNQHAINTYNSNFRSQMLGMDIKTISDLDFKKLKVDIIFGGPPCQGFSTAGKQDVFDPRNQLYKEFARATRLILPVAFVLENVKGMLTMQTPNGGLLIKDLIRTFDKIGYNVRYKVLNAASYGSPQNRERLIFIGIRKDLNIIPSFPEPLYLQFMGLYAPRYQSLKSIIGDLKELANGEHTDDPLHFCKLYSEVDISKAKSVKQGGKIFRSPDKHGFYDYFRPKYNSISPTVIANYNITKIVHPTQDRAFSLRELARIQGFKDDFIFHGSSLQITKQIGNAVSVDMSTVLAKHLIDQLKDLI
jgi:DNA (cytosine-5)-methyltransferase 1